MKKKIFLLLGPFVFIGGCCNQCLVMDVSERQLIDARFDHLRCEVYLDRLRDLYRVTDEEPGGLMDDSLDPLGEDPETGVPSFDDPLTGKHDGPLIGKHDGPLTRGHDDPLTGKHDDIDDLREAVIGSANQCWAVTEDLIDRYNKCVVDFVQCRDDGDPNCDTEYSQCLDDNRPT